MGMLYLLSEGSAARKVGPRIAVEKDGVIIGRLPVRSIDGVVLGRDSQITTQATFELLEQMSCQEQPSLHLSFFIRRLNHLLILVVVSENTDSF